MQLSRAEGKLAVVTGGSSGIGNAIAKELARRKFDLLLVARNAEKLETAKSALANDHPVRIHTLSVDVSKESEVEQLAKRVKEIAGCADILVNAAGIVSAGKLHETPITEWDRLHNINVRGLVLVLQSLIPDMVKQFSKDQQQRHIVNVGSAAGYAGTPGMSAYGATKAAVQALSESLRAELAESDIGVTSLCPGFVRTPIAETVQLFGSMQNPKIEKQVQKMFSRSNLEAEAVAAQAVKAIEKNKDFVSVGLDATGSHYLKRLSPQLLSRAVSLATSR